MPKFEGSITKANRRNLVNIKETSLTIKRNIGTNTGRGARS
jgi:hypothetical protein